MALIQLWNEVRLYCCLIRRYWQESLAAFGATLGVFGGLIYAVTALGDIDLASGKLDGMLVGFVLWMFACSAYAGIASEVVDEIHQRSLEQLCMAPLALPIILALRATIKIVAGTGVLALLLGIVDVLSGERLALSYTGTLATLLLAAPSLVGLGYMIAGVLLVARKAQAVQLMVYPAIIAVVACPAYPLNLAAVLPFCLGASAVKAAASGTALPATIYALIGANSAFWLAAGVLLFRRLERQAKHLGVMGHV